MICDYWILRRQRLSLKELFDPRGRYSYGGAGVNWRAIVALADGKPVELQLLYPHMGIVEPLAAVAERYDLDREALQAAAQSALAAPDRVVSLEVAARASA